MLLQRCPVKHQQGDSAADSSTETANRGIDGVGLIQGTHT